MIDHLRAMAIFQSVVDAGSFRAAARRLNLSPSVVTHHISQLEDRLGTALLYRTTRRLSLTDDGAHLYAACCKMLDAARTGLATLEGRAREPTGALRVAAPGTVFEHSPFVDLVADFSKRFSRVEMSISFSDQKIDLLGSLFDVAIRVGWLDDSRYKSRKLCELERAMVVASDLLARKPVPKTIADLEDWHWIKLTQLSLPRQLTNARGEQPGISPRVVIEVDSVAALVQLAKRGLGVVCVPRFLVSNELHSGELTALAPDWQLMAPAMSAVWPGNVSEGSLTRRFVEFAVERLRAV